MAITDARKSANADGVVYRIAVYLRTARDGGAKYKYVRQPFDLVRYDWGNGDRSSYMQLTIGSGVTRSTNVEYDEVRFVSAEELVRLPSIGAYR